MCDCSHVASVQPHLLEHPSSNGLVVVFFITEKKDRKQEGKEFVRSALGHDMWNAFEKLREPWRSTGWADYRMPKPGRWDNKSSLQIQMVINCFTG